MDSNIQCFFTRYNGYPDKELIRIISTAKTSLDIAIYSLTKKEIVNSIIEAKNRGISIRIITDKQESTSKYESVELIKLKNAGIPIKINSHRGLMHLKTIIVDNNIATSGSYNYTEGASHENDEVLLVIYDLIVINQIKDVYEKMWNDNKRFKDY